MPVGEYAAGKALRIACAALLPGWLLLWVVIVLLGTSADTVHLRPCSARAASTFGGHRRELHDGLELVPYDASMSRRTQPNARNPRAGRASARASAAAAHVQRLQEAAGAFAYVCMQPRCNPRLLCTSAAALRSVGGWRGPLYVITDHPEALRMHCQALFTEVYTPQRDEAGYRSVRAQPLQLLPGNVRRVVLLSPGTITVSCLAPFLTYLSRLKYEIGMSIAPDDSAWRGRTFDPGLVLHRESGSSRDCSAAWAADSVQRVSREHAAASDAASLAHVEGNKARGGCRRHHRLPRRFFVAMNTSIWLIKAKMLVRRPVFVMYSEPMQSRWYWRYTQRALERQVAAVA